MAGRSLFCCICELAMVTLMLCAFRVMPVDADHFGLCPVRILGSHHANVHALCLFRIVLVLVYDVCHASCQRPIHELVFRLRLATKRDFHCEHDFKASRQRRRQLTLSLSWSYRSPELPMRSSREEITGFTSTAVEAIAFAIKCSVPKSTFKHFGLDAGHWMPCNAWRVSTASLRKRKEKCFVKIEDVDGKCGLVTGGELTLQFHIERNISIWFCPSKIRFRQFCRCAAADLWVVKR